MGIAYFTGALALKNSLHHSYRDKSEFLGITNRHFEPTKDRTIRVEKLNKEAVFKHELYREDDMPRKYFLRQRNHCIEDSSIMRYQPRDMTERIQKSINNTNKVDFEASDMTTYFFPKFRDQEKNLWKTKNGFSVKDSGQNIMF